MTGQQGHLFGQLDTFDGIAAAEDSSAAAPANAAAAAAAVSAVIARRSAADVFTDPRTGRLRVAEVIDHSPALTLELGGRVMAWIPGPPAPYRERVL